VTREEAIAVVADMAKTVPAMKRIWKARADRTAINALAEKLIATLLPAPFEHGKKVSGQLCHVKVKSVTPEAVQEALNAISGAARYERLRAEREERQRREDEAWQAELKRRAEQTPEQRAAEIDRALARLRS
jgi:hypothetical protein